jgi:uncharacterized membrane protein YedE/YeeE
VKRLGTAFIAGLVFALGLALSGMTNPGKVIGFLDLAGAWDPSLAFVMAGAIAVHVAVARWSVKARRPLFDDRFYLPPATAIDRPLIGGAMLFGIGWGIAGYCPGPALVGAVGLAPTTWLFLLAMLAGTAAYRRVTGS